MFSDYKTMNTACIQSEKITVNFRDLEALAFQSLELPLFEVLASRQEQYQDVTPTQILNLLEEAAQTYAIVAPTLPSCLQNSAKKEIGFFLELYLDRLINSRTTQNPQPPKNMLILNLPDDQARFPCDGRSWWGSLPSPLTP
jgi:hypothetical protein